LSILKDEELFQFRLHVTLKLLSRRSAVNRADLLRRINRVQRLFRPCTDSDVLGQIDPSHRAVRIDVKLGRAGNI